MGTKLSQWNRFSWFRFSKIHNVPGEWLSNIAAHVGRVAVNSVFETKASSSTMCSTSASTNPSPNEPSCSIGLVPYVLDAVYVSKLHKHLFLHVHLQERKPDHRHRHPRRQGLPIARFCHRDPGLYTCKWARRTFDSAQDYHSRDLCALFAAQRRWRALYHIEACMNRMARERAFQRYPIRVCRPWRC